MSHSSIGSGFQIAAARALAGVSQDVLAAVAGIHVSAVRFNENKLQIDFNVPSVRAIERALLRLGVVTFAQPTLGARFLTELERSPGDIAIEQAERRRAIASHSDRGSGPARASASEPAKSELPPDPKPGICGVRTRRGKTCRFSATATGRCVVHSGLRQVPAEVHDLWREMARGRWAQQRAAGISACGLVSRTQVRERSKIGGFK